ncbi:hypothetical protein [Ferruginivarius sediminum]|uniref:Uncharacterized protein n=1 Tax=Ferruginivarius sediminum TaxID=2661937 RepID=A0A369T7J5_9PROT|nr:hypothetical protein [Ferruginivarius sediminum]RDD61248.1 hypothetical protein DRB17_14305 [Ferruginivarius sediminum]
MAVKFKKGSSSDKTKSAPYSGSAQVYEKQLSVRLPLHVVQDLKQLAADKNTTLRAVVLDALTSHYGLNVDANEKQDKRPAARKLQAELYQKLKQGEISLDT